MEAACVPLDSGHASGTLDRAQPILAAHPQLVSGSIYAAPIVGEDAAVGRFLELDIRNVIFHNKKHPATMGAPEITAFLSSLATTQHVSASTQNQALSALLFLYRHVLRMKSARFESGRAGREEPARSLVTVEGRR